MGKFVILLILLIIFIGVFAALFIFPFLRQKYLDKELHSQMLIGLSDFKGHYSLIEHRPRTNDDIDVVAKGLGWKEGYHAVYEKIGGFVIQNPENIYLVQDNSIYPIENISKTIDFFKKTPNYVSNGMFDEKWNLSVIKTPDEIKGIGDDSIVYEGRLFLNGTPLHSFSAYFIKNNVFQAVTLSGDEKAISMDEFIYYVKIINNLTLNAQ